MRRRSASGGPARMSWPSSRIWPLSHSSSRLISRSSVDLPEPDAPISAVMRPGSMRSDTPSTARVAPKDLHTSRKSITAVGPPASAA
jgi:hypothetical protein